MQITSPLRPRLLARNVWLLLSVVVCLTTMTASALVSGNKTALVMLVNMNNAPIDCNNSTVAGFFFNNSPLNVNSYFQHSTYGNVSWSGNVITVTINFNTTPCTRDPWSDAADAAARAQGFEPNNYTVRVYAFPSSVPNCGYAAAAGTRVVTMHCTDLFAYGHEVGHSIGMNHASTDLDNNGTIDNEYGGMDDCMGGESYMHNAPHKIWGEWLPQRSTGSGGWTTITTDGTYVLSPLELNPLNSSVPNRQAFKISAGGDPYFFSYRQPLDFDAGWTAAQVGKNGASGTIVDPVPPISSYAYDDGVNIHRHNGASGVQTREIRVLTDNATFSIPGTSIVIRQTGHNSSSCTFTVTGLGGGTTGVKFYQDINYGGTVGQTLTPGDYTLSQLQAKGIPNDWASSCQVPSGWTVTMYANDNFSGTSWTRTADTPNFTTLSPNANDQMTSCRITTSSTGVTFYQDTNYGGTPSQLLAKGNYTLSQLQAKGVSNDWASSCRIPSGWTVIIYQHDNFTGTSWTLTSDTPNFTSFSGLNDNMSSCRVQ